MFAVKRGEIGKRLDPYANQPKFTNYFQALRKTFKTCKLAEITSAIFSGITPKSGEEAYADISTGVPFIRSGNINADGTVGDADIYIKIAIHNGIMKDSKLYRDDILIAIVGATIGRVGIYKDGKQANINQAIAAVRLNDNRFIPEFIVCYLQSRTGQMFLDYLKRPVARANINLEEIGSIEVPTVLLDVQRCLVSDMSAASKQRTAKLREADELLAGMDGFVREILGLPKEDKTRSMVFAVKILPNEIERIDPEYHNPFYQHRIKRIKEMKHDTLGNIIEFSNETWNQQSDFMNMFPYIDISGVGLKTNDYRIRQMPITEAPSRAKMIVRDKDIIISTTRPHRGAIATINCEDGFYIASTGFCVLREMKRDDVAKEYLQWVLLNDYILQQLLQRSSGGNYPAITQDEMKKVVIPIPDKAIQKKIIKEAVHRKSTVRQLKHEAETAWVAAKERFERELMGENLS